MKQALSVFLLAVLTGCTGLKEFVNNNPVAADTAIRIAATQYISAGDTPEQVEQRAIAVRDKVDSLLKELDSNPTLSLVSLEQQFRESIDWQEMTIADQVLADALIINVRLQLEKRVSDQTLPADYSVALKTLLSVILNSTRLYGV